MITDRQREARKLGLGSSDMAAIFGVSKYRTAVDVWADKTGKVEPQQDYPSEAARIGSAMEPALLAMAGERLGRKVVAPTSTFVRGVLRANVDGMLDRFQRGSDIVEAKCHGQPIGYGPDGSGEIPDAVMLQVQHQMLCAESRLAYVAVLDGQRLGFALYRIEADDGYQAEIQARATEFWERYVVPDVQPAGSLTLDTASRINRIAGTSTYVASELIERYVVARQTVMAAEREMDSAKAELLTALGQAECASGAGYRITYRQRSRTSFDGKRFAEENPDIAERYTKSTTFRVLDVKEETK